MPQKSLKDLTGKWKMSKSASSDPAPVLELQGVNAFIRKAASSAPVSLDITQKGTEEYFIKQSTTASIPGISEEWYPSRPEKWVEGSDQLLGKSRSRSKWGRVGELEGIDAWLLEGLDGGEEMVVAEVESSDGNGWRAVQVWFVDGEGRFVRRVITTGGKGAQGKGEGEEKRVESLLIYEFEG